MKLLTVSTSIFCALAMACGDSQGPGPAVTPDAGSEITDSGSPADPDSAPVDPGEVEACPVETTGTSQLYDHNVKSATSTDGVNFVRNDTTLLEHASVPDGVIGNDGKTWVYFVNGVPGQHAIFIAKRDGDALTTFDCIRIDGKVNGNAVDPDIIRLADGRFRLHYFQGWFVGEEKPQPGELHPIYSAISSDGINFTVEGKVFEYENIYDPTVAQLADGTWMMGLNHPDGALLATSVDGKSYQLMDHKFEAGVTELHAFDGGKTLRYYIASKDGFLIYKSTDAGSTWAKEATANVGGADPSMVAEDDGTWTLYVKTFSGNKGGNGGDNPPNPPTPPSPPTPPTP